MICISGIPGTGKTTLCKMLNENNLRCVNLNSIADENGIMNGDTVNIDALKKIDIKYDIVESHYSHLINCDYVIILKDDEDGLINRMRGRGYSDSKINENLDAQRSDTIYYEALDHLPENHIFIINEDSRNINSVFNEVLNLILSLNKKVN